MSVARCEDCGGRPFATIGGYHLHRVKKHGDTPRDRALDRHRSTVPVCVRLSYATYEDVIDRARERGVSVNVVIRDALHDHLDGPSDARASA